MANIVSKTKKRGVRCRKCGGKGIIHQTRNGKKQYRCKDCWSYFTPTSNHERASNSNLLDDFLTAYSRAHKAKKKSQEEPDIKLSVILKGIPALSNSKSTVYRNKSKIKTLAILCTWFRNAGIISNWDYKNFNLRVWYRWETSKVIPTLEASVSSIPNNPNKVVIKIKAKKGTFNQIDNISFVKIVRKDGEDEISYETHSPIAEQDLHPFLARLRSLMA